MPATSGADPLRNHLGALKAAEASFELRLRGFLPNADDDLDIQAVFLSHADNSRVWCEMLEKRIDHLPGGDQSYPVASHLADLPVPLINANHIQEERIVHDLISAFSIHSTECAMAEVVTALSASNGDTETERLSREIQTQARQSANRVFSLIPSRAKIAFNMLTPHELDPAVETKMADDRVI